MSPTAAPVIASDARPHEHLVAFYETESYLSASVAAFLGPALADGGVAVVLATPEHHGAFVDALSADGVDAEGAGERYVRLDAAQTLAEITRDGAVDPGLFGSVIGERIRRLTGAGRPVHIYGELVALLWDRGDALGALAVEEMWNELANSTPFELFCAYPTSVFEQDLEVDGFRAVCDAHTQVLPTESTAKLTDEGEQHLALALLERQTAAATNERDVLRRKQAELESALEQLAGTERSQQRFTAMVIHDLQNPAVVISGVLDLLRTGWSDLDEVQIEHYLTLATRSASQIQRLLDDLLLKARLGSGAFTFELRPVDLERLVTDVVGEVRDRTGRTIHLAIATGLPRAYADEGRQLQVLNNLLSNAIKFSDADTPVTVEVERQGDRLAVQVRDLGRGIEPTELAQLFQPFSRLQRSGDGGTGLGLFISKALVEGQGGTISASSELGVGTTLTYTIPAAG